MPPKMCPKFDPSKKDLNELRHAVETLYSDKRKSPSIADATKDQLVELACKASRIPKQKPSPLPHAPNGTEPTFTQRRWIRKVGIENANCYSYALGDFSSNRPRKATPGARAGKTDRIPFSKCAEWNKRVVADNPNHVTLLDDPYAKCPNGTFKVMLFTTGDSTVGSGDFHLYRMHRSGLWSHKRGHHTPPLIHDASGNPIWDPLKANRNYGSLNYRKFCGAFCVRRGAKTI